MEVELVAEGISEEDIYAVDEYNDDYSAFDGERCGICMDIVVDRGVLDCCQHWFCFACIDNWATITNLCPLCQNEFQLITCVPVYDTIGSNKSEEDSYSRDDDWCIEGKNNTLSFPSYYIDEDAVVCLDGDGCQIRSGSAKVEEDSNLDTSIACDSCDIWYHAFCVGYDPEGTCENSWLCPRCLVNEMPHKSVGVPVSGPSNQHLIEKDSSECLVEVAFSGKMSVSVADAGETAVVVSMIEKNQGTEEPSEKFSSTLDASEGLKLDTSCDVANIPKMETLSSERIRIGPNLEAQELGLSLSRETSFSFQSNSLVLNELKTNPDDKAICNPNVPDGFGSTSRKLFVEHCSDDLLESGLDLHLCLTVGSSLSDKMNNDVAENHDAGDVPQKNSMEECFLPANKVIRDKKENVIGTSCTKRKYRDCRIAEDGEAKSKMETNISVKKAKGEKNSYLINSKGQAHESVSVDPRMSRRLVTVSKDDKLRCISEKESVPTDIMDIVQVTDHRSLKQLANGNSADMSLQERENAAGLRVKKIMRRASEDKESSMLVQKLRKEIREAVRNKSSKEYGENLFDQKLLVAFRAAVAGPVTKPKQSPPLDLKAKKLLLQKGKIRENLTKKIYGIGGRRRRAWTRDCEIEFWKHRCLKISKPEKIETLKSVLDLLRNGSESTEMKHGIEGEATTSILSRLYLADTSVCPRKDDVKPFSALKTDETPEQTLAEKASTQSLGICSSETPRTSMVSSKVGIPSSDNKGTKSGAPRIKGEAASNRVHLNKPPERPSISALGGVKVNPLKEMVSKSDDIKSDKKKWALEVLARKTAVKGKSGSQEKQEDNAVVKGNYPLMAQLPADMRPVLAPTRHNKIPISIRQVQLYRLTEHFLRKTNLAVIHRTAEIELAVADATNIEKEVADRSNSKLVYVNLCSQELLHRSDCINSGRVTESNPPPTSAVSADISEAEASNLSSDPVVEEALRNAGLLSDSPPNSPHHQMEEIKEDPSQKNKDEGPDNVIEMDPHPELDIYGDFEYDLEDEDFIGATAATISKVQPEGELKMKLLFSTVIPGTSNDTLDTKDLEKPAVEEVPRDTSDLLECHIDASIERSAVESRTDNNCPPQNSSLGGGDEEPSLAECEELYGPDVEPLIKRFPETTSTEPCKLIPNIMVLGKDEDCESNQVVTASEHEGDNFAAGGPSVVGELLNHSKIGEDGRRKGKISKVGATKQSNSCNSVFKKVETYIKEHIRPLCKSGVITVEQYRWAVGKTIEKVLKYHSKDKNANFLIKEGDKVKKLAEEYVEASQWMEKN
ncbi:unnamed protein product [Ilex paraguariensis]|uniref:Uncharacterized protein n=1 Tax=Ilex paraguariensis TaxID=185542 RepID=A0ABC8RJE3_9AQUA